MYKLKNIQSLFKFLKLGYILTIVCTLTGINLNSSLFISTIVVPIAKMSGSLFPYIMLLSSAVLGILGLFLVICFVIFFVYFYRIVYNCSKFSSEMKYKPCCSVFYFFIPIINFYRPYQVIKSVWIISSKKLNDNEETNLLLLKYYWFFCLLNIGILFFIALGANNLLVYIIEDLSAILLSLTSLKLFSLITKKQTAIIDKINSEVHWLQLTQNESNS
ncbi:MAG: hypothetical protein C0412_06840 [Flavobacterium sp.]|nr:hypothetical protein [Flavobacterium sp.]